MQDLLQLVDEEGWRFAIIFSSILSPAAKEDEYAPTPGAKQKESTPSTGAKQDKHTPSPDVKPGKHTPTMAIRKTTTNLSAAKAEASGSCQLRSSGTIWLLAFLRVLLDRAL